MRVMVGGTALIVVIATDDTRRHESEDRLKENEEGFLRPFESAQGAYYRTDANGAALTVAPPAHGTPVSGRGPWRHLRRPSPRRPAARAFEGRAARVNAACAGCSA